MQDWLDGGQETWTQHCGHAAYGILFDAEVYDKSGPRACTPAQVPASKAPGADSWTFQHLAEWPDCLWEAQVGFYGRWPVDRPAHLVVLLPKRSTPAPMDRRPVVSLPVVYRLWAAVHGRGMRDWLREAGVLRGGGMLAADTLADEAPLVELALDVYKSYDRRPWSLCVTSRCGLGCIGRWPGTCWLATRTRAASGRKGWRGRP